jgi:transcriptional regulator with XRE-family HTH domain
MDLREALGSSGRSVSWLARKTGYSRGHVSAILNGERPATDEFLAHTRAALGVEGTVVEMYRGRPIRLEASVFRAPYDADGEVYERAWKESWVREHGQALLATAAERAWQEATGGRAA